MRLKYFAACSLFLASATLADIDVGSDGSDGALVATNTPINLAEAAEFCDCDGVDQGNDGNLIDDPCRWDCPSPLPGKGVYDAEQWAVVFKYNSVTVPAGVTASFLNHRSFAPVVWLVDGSVTITGVVNISGKRGHSYTEPRTLSEPGPGGFRGGRGADVGAANSCGMGPGAGIATSNSDGRGGSYATQGNGGQCNTGAAGPMYGNAANLPLIGGSGGAGGNGLGNCHPDHRNGGGGAGGGAILIAANNSITLTGSILANGGNAAQNDSADRCDSGLTSCNGRGKGGSGSGGAIRLVADSITGNGATRAVGGKYPSGEWLGGGGFGRIRIEGNSIQLTDPGVPLFVPDLPTFVFPPPNYPRLRAASVSGQQVPLDPNARIIDAINDPDVRLATTSSVPLRVEAENVPVGTLVNVQITPASGACANYTSTALEDLGGILHASADVHFPAGFSVVQLRATFPPSALSRHGDAQGGSRLKALRTLIGEHITRIAFTASPSGATEAVYITDTGRQIPVGGR